MQGLDPPSVGDGIKICLQVKTQLVTNLDSDELKAPVPAQTVSSSTCIQSLHLSYYRGFCASNV